MIKEASNEGLIHFGENYVQELLQKQQVLGNVSIHWHFIGHLQSNKVKNIAPWISLIHSVDSISLAKEIQKRGEQLNRTINVLVEVNTSHEKTKFGVTPEQALQLLTELSEFNNIEVQGLMTLGPNTEEETASRNSFSTLRQVCEEANRLGSYRTPITELSMGMSHDFPIAIQEGATIIRLGTAIFGEREYSQ